MFTRRFKQAFARVCIALLCMQAAVAAYACPAFVADIEAAAKATAHEVHQGAMGGDCAEQHPGNNAGKTMCHQHYAGDQAVGTAGLGSASAALTLPLAIVTLLEPAKLNATTVLPVLLQRSTTPPLSIQFQVLRI